MKRWQFWMLTAAVLVLAAAITADAIVRSETRFEPEVWGTISDWVIGIIFGIGTVLFAGLAWYWARRGAKAQEREAHLSAVTAPVAFDCRVRRTAYVASGPELDTYNYHIGLKLTEDSTPCYVRAATFRPWGKLSNEENWTSDLDQVWAYSDEGVLFSPGLTMSNVWEVHSEDGTAPDDDTNRNIRIWASVHYTLDGPNDPTDHILTYHTELKWPQ